MVLLSFDSAIALQQYLMTTMYKKEFLYLLYLKKTTYMEVTFLIQCLLAIGSGQLNM